MENGTVVGVVVAAFSAFASAAFAWLNARDKLRFDSERTQMKARITQLETDNADCHDRYDRLEAKLDAEKKTCDERINAMQTQVNTLLSGRHNRPDGGRR